MAQLVRSASVPEQLTEVMSRGASLSPNAEPCERDVQNTSLEWAFTSCRLVLLPVDLFKGLLGCVRRMGLISLRIDVSSGFLELVLPLHFSCYRFVQWLLLKHVLGLVQQIIYK